MRFDRPRRRALGRASWQRVAKAVLRRDLYRCQACGDPATMAGHRVPPHLYAGHHNDPANLVAICRPCNVSQGATPYDEWLLRPYGRPAMIRARQAGHERSTRTRSYGARIHVPSAMIRGDYTRRETSMTAPLPTQRPHDHWLEVEEPGEVVCNVCEQIMDGSSCLPGVWVPRDGAPAIRRQPHTGPDEECHDCNVRLGRIHHEACDMERCAHDLQAWFSDCCEIVLDDEGPEVQ